MLLWLVHPRNKTICNGELKMQWIVLPHGASPLTALQFLSVSALHPTQWPLLFWAPPLKGPLLGALCPNVRVGGLLSERVIGVGEGHHSWHGALVLVGGVILRKEVVPVRKFSVNKKRHNWIKLEGAHHRISPLLSLWCIYLTPPLPHTTHTHNKKKVPKLVVLV